MLLSVVLPAFNETKNLPRVLGELTSLLKKQNALSSFEIIVVDDHSTDGTFGAVKNLENPHIRLARLSRRSGSHSALRAGLKIARGDAVLCLAADGQDDPNIIERMLEQHRGGGQVVWALRESRTGEALPVRAFAAAFYKALGILTGVKNSSIDLSRADFYLLDRKVVDALNSCQELNTSLFGLIAWIGFRQSFVEYQRRERISGKSKWNFRSRMHLAKDWIAGFSGIPLKSMTLIGFATSLFGFAYAAYIIVNAIFGHPAEGWSSLMVVTLLIGGVQMIMLGIIGEYLWRTLEETRKRPLFFVEDSANEARANESLPPSQATPASRARD